MPLPFVKEKLIGLKIKKIYICVQCKELTKKNVNIILAQFPINSVDYNLNLTAL